MNFFNSKIFSKFTCTFHPKILHFVNSSLKRETAKKKNSEDENFAKKVVPFEKESKNKSWSV